jgi:hypothetical protein
VTIPTNLPNGVYNVRIVLNDAASSASNSRTLEVIPRIDSPIGLATVVAPGPPSHSVHQLTITGTRLAGSDIRLLIDGVNYLTGTNANPTQLVYTLQRLLSPGSHSIAVNIDGHLSRTVELEV